MKRHIIVISIALFVCLLLGSISFAYDDYVHNQEQITWSVRNEGWLYLITVSNSAGEYWTSYDQFDHKVFKHINAGSIFNGLDYPFDIYPSYANFLYSNGNYVDRIWQYEFEPISPYIGPPNYIYYGGEAFINIYLPKYNSAEVEANYGIVCDGGSGTFGPRSTSQWLTMWN